MPQIAPHSTAKAVAWDRGIGSNRGCEGIKKVVEGVVKYQLKGASNYHGIRALKINKCQKLLRETNTHFLGKLSGSSSKHPANMGRIRLTPQGDSGILFTT